MTKTPTHIQLHQQSGILKIEFDSGEKFEYTCEFLRVYSQSAEVTGHAPGQEVLQLNKQDVLITAIHPVGNYAIRPVFSDGHDSGIYTWERLYDLGMHYQKYWVDYLRRLMRAGHDHPALTQLKQELHS
jgi:DUF971 family protein